MKYIISKKICYNKLETKGEFMKECYVEIDVKTLKNNVKNIIEKYPNYKYYIGVIKGNAYGHGLDIVKYIIDSGINYLAVSTLEEALYVRKIVNIPILCLQPISLDELAIASKNNIAITLSSYDYYKQLIKKNIKIDVHLKLDTGMNRLGLNKKDEVDEIYNNLITNRNIKLQGLYTHLATLGIMDKKWDNQVDNFLYLTSDIDLNKIDLVHIFSTNSLVIHPKLNFCNGVRIGILMYGICPNPIRYNGIKGKIRKIKKNYLVNKYNISKTYDNYNVEVKPCLKLISKVIEIKDVKRNEYIGYGLNYKTPINTRVAIIPVGYLDGLSLQNSGRYLTINNNRYKIVGSINMKMLTVIVDKKVEVGDTVTVIGDDIRYICNYTKVTPHNLLTSISSNIKREYK